MVLEQNSLGQFFFVSPFMLLKFSLAEDSAGDFMNWQGAMLGKLQKVNRYGYVLFSGAYCSSYACSLKNM